MAPLCSNSKSDGVTVLFALLAALITMLMTLYGLVRGLARPGQLLGLILLAEATLMSLLVTVNLLWFVMASLVELAVAAHLIGHWSTSTEDNRQLAVTRFVQFQGVGLALLAGGMLILAWGHGHRTGQRHVLLYAFQRAFLASRLEDATMPTVAPPAALERVLPMEYLVGGVAVCVLLAAGFFFESWLRLIVPATQALAARFGGIVGLILRNARCLAARRIGKPFRRDIQIAIHHGSHLISRHGSEDTHLAVVGLAQTPIPLTSHPRRLVALLRKTAFIDDQCADTAKVGIGINHQLPLHIAPIPGRLAQHVMKVLVLAPADCFSHFLHIAPTALEQPMKVLLCRAYNRARRATEALGIRSKVGIELAECRINQFNYAFKIFDLTWY